MEGKETVGGVFDVSGAKVRLQNTGLSGSSNHQSKLGKLASHSGLLCFLLL